MDLLIGSTHKKCSSDWWWCPKINDNDICNSCTTNRRCYDQNSVRTIGQNKNENELHFPCHSEQFFSKVTDLVRRKYIQKSISNQNYAGVDADYASSDDNLRHEKSARHNVKLREPKAVVPYCENIVKPGAFRMHSPFGCLQLQDELILKGLIGCSSYNLVRLYCCKNCPERIPEKFYRV